MPHLKIISRQDALASKRKYYFTGKPCVNGHLSERDSYTTDCKKCRNISQLKRTRAKREQLKTLLENVEDLSDNDLEIIKKQRIEGMLHNCRYRAKARNIEFSLKREDIVLPKICPCLGIKINYFNEEGKDDSPSIDRIDSSKGYTKDNISVISNRANTLKNNGSIEEFESIIKYLKLLKYQ